MSPFTVVFTNTAFLVSLEPQPQDDSFSRHTENMFFATSEASLLPAPSNKLKTFEKHYKRYYICQVLLIDVNRFLGPKQKP